MLYTVCDTVLSMHSRMLFTDKLDVICAPFPVDGQEHQGMINLRPEWCRTQSDTAHNTVIHEVVHHWVGNAFTVRGWGMICWQACVSSHSLDVPACIRRV